MNQSSDNPITKNFTTNWWDWKDKLILCPSLEKDINSKQNYVIHTWGSTDTKHHCRLFTKVLLKFSIINYNKLFIMLSGQSWKKAAILRG